MNKNAETLYGLAEQTGLALKTAGLMLVTAESCTGGWVGEVVTAVPGSSHWYDRGFITYTNLAKQEMLGVSTETLAQYGAVSEPVVREMAIGALKNSHAHIAVAISGIAGPGGATQDKPLGTVCMAWALNGECVQIETNYFKGDRQEVRAQAVQAALMGLLKIINK